MLEVINISRENNYTNDVLKTLLYFDAFNYPITALEIEQYSHFSSKEIHTELKKLLNKKVIFSFDEFYSISKNKNHIERRRKGNENALKIFKKATKMSAFISQFPFVEGVFLSGSMSKGYFGKGDDIDYFIITAPNRLWLTRTLLIAYKKVFLLNSKKYFCINYLMSTNSLEITEKNRFTATEFATLIPMSGNGIYCDLKNNNPWVLDYFPNYTNQNKNSIAIKKNVYKRFLEFIFNGKIGKWLDEYFMSITKNRQSRKFKKLQKNDFDIAFKGNKNISKHHPGNNQKKIINLLNKSIIAFNKKHNLSIPLEK